MDVMETGYTYHKRKNVRQQVNTEIKKTAAARPEGGGRRRLWRRRSRRLRFLYTTAAKPPLEKMRIDEKGEGGSGDFFR